MVAAAHRRRVSWRGRALTPGEDRVGDLFGGHHHREVGVGAGDDRKHRGVDDPEPFDGMHASGGVGDRHRVVDRPHAAGAGGMPDADRGAADEVGQHVVVLEQNLQVRRLDDQLVHEQAAQRRRSVEKPRNGVGQHLVLAADRPYLAEPFAVDSAEGVAGNRRQCRMSVERRHLAKGVHQPLEIAVIGEKVELDDRLLAPIPRRQLDLAGLRPCPVDEDEQRPDLLADPVPRRLLADGDIHVALGRVGDARGVA